MIYTGLNRTGEIETVKANGGADVAEVYGGIGESNPIYYKQREMVGTSPMQFKALGLPLKDYRIYGETLQDGTPSPDMPVDAAGCGVRTENLAITERGGINKDTGVDQSYTNSRSQIRTQYVQCTSNTTYTFSSTLYPAQCFIAFYDKNKQYLSRTNGYTLSTAYVFNTPNGAAFMRATFYNNNTEIQIFPYSDGAKITLNLGSTALPYEPYGYKIPVTIGNTTTPIYIGSDPLYRIGDYADEVDFGNQRIIRRVNPTTMQPYETPIASTATVPQLTAVFGDNTLTVDTTVKPSAVSITGNVKPTGYGQLLDANDVDIRDSNSTPIFIRG